MNLQDIRKYYEYPVIDCCNLQGVSSSAPKTPSNRVVTRTTSFAWHVSSSGEMAEQTIACGPISATSVQLFVVEYHGPKGIGPADAQDFMECVLCSFHDLKGW